MREVFNNGKIRARLISYPPGATFERHLHSNFYASIMLLGSMQEETGSGTAEYLSPHFALMPPDFAHANMYGKYGALELVFDFETDMLHTDFDLHRAERNAHRVDSTQVAALVSALVNKPACWREDGFTDLLALALIAEDRVEKSPPPWLSRARDYFDDDPSAARVASVAHACGVHRVHLVRVFRDYLGMTPTQYRLQAMTIRAVALMQTESDNVSAAAASAGFADASHFAREVRKRTGISPSSLKNLHDYNRLGDQMLHLFSRGR